MKLYHLLTVIQFETKLTILYNGIERLITYDSPMNSAITDIKECDVKNVTVEDNRLYIEL